MQRLFAWVYLVVALPYGFISSPVLSCHTYVVTSVSDSFVFALLVDIYLFEALKRSVVHIRMLSAQGR